MPHSTHTVYVRDLLRFAPCKIRHSDSETVLTVDNRVITKERAYQAYSSIWEINKYTSDELGEIQQSQDIKRNVKKRKRRKQRKR